MPGQYYHRMSIDSLIETTRGKTTKVQYCDSSAEISSCGKYRYSLRRDWNFGEGVICFVMLNPSTADWMVDDPTIRRCVGFAQKFGFQSLVVKNLFNYRATNPKALLEVEDPVGKDGNYHILKSLYYHTVVAAWGTNVIKDRDKEVLRIYKEQRKTVWCLRKTKAGYPAHPLYLPAAATLQIFQD